VTGCVEEAVARVIATMYERLGEKLRIDDLAQAAMFSKFHFSRIFQGVTGVSPGRFLSALRLQEAKHLLVSTPLNVADISLLVGYHSVGTFGTRFTRSVGLSPTTFRRTGGFVASMPVNECGGGAGMPSAMVCGCIHASPDRPPGPVYVGLFPGRIPEGRPDRYAILESPGPYVLQGVPEGRWYLLAHSIDGDHRPDAGGVSGGPSAASVGSCGPVTIRRNTVIGSADLRLRPMQLIDPPVLVAPVVVPRTTASSLRPRDSRPSPRPQWIRRGTGAEAPHSGVARAPR
jgi:AraC family transcriptional regulator